MSEALISAVNIESSYSNQTSNIEFVYMEATTDETYQLYHTPIAVYEFSAGGMTDITIGQELTLYSVVGSVGDRSSGTVKLKVTQNNIVKILQSEITGYKIMLGFIYE